VPLAQAHLFERRQRHQPKKLEADRDHKEQRIWKAINAGRLVAWPLVGGLIVCTGCKPGQSTVQSEVTFLHEPSCLTKNAVEALPWAELRQIWIVDWLMGIDARSIGRDL